MKIHHPRTTRQANCAGLFLRLRRTSTGFIAHFLNATGGEVGQLALTRRPTPAWLGIWEQLGYRIVDQTAPQYPAHNDRGGHHHA